MSNASKDRTVYLLAVLVAMIFLASACGSPSGTSDDGSAPREDQPAQNPPENQSGSDDADDRDDQNNDGGDSDDGENGHASNDDNDDGSDDDDDSSNDNGSEDDGVENDDGE